MSHDQQQQACQGKGKNITNTIPKEDVKDVKDVKGIQTTTTTTTPTTTTTTTTTTMTTNKKETTTKEKVSESTRKDEKKNAHGGKGIVMPPRKQKWVLIGSKDAIEAAIAQINKNCGFPNSDCQTWAQPALWKSITPTIQSNQEQTVLWSQKTMGEQMKFLQTLREQHQQELSHEEKKQQNEQWYCAAPPEQGVTFSFTEHHHSYSSMMAHVKNVKSIPWPMVEFL